METTTPRPICPQEALALLNCAAAAPYDRDRCLTLLDSVRDCIVQKRVKKFSLAEPSSTAPAEAPKSDLKP